MTGHQELARLARDLGNAGGSIMSDLHPVMKRAAQNIKTDLVENVRASRHFKGMARSISYDRVDVSPTSVVYEVGPDKARPGGGLGNIAFFGTSRGGGTVDLEGPLFAEVPNLEREAMNILKGWDR